MNAYLRITLTAVLVVVGFIGAYLFTPLFKPAQARVAEQVQERVDKAAAMLGSYDPGDANLLRLVETPSTQPAETDPEYAKYLQRRSELIREALAIASEAVNLRTDSGEGGGDTHPAATRLEATLVFDQADVLRRQAAVQQAAAEKAAGELARYKAAWDEADARVNNLETGLTRQGKVLVRAEAPVAPPAEAAAPAAEAAAPTAEAASEPAKKPEGLFSSLVAKAFGPQQAKPLAQPEPAAEAEPEAPAVPEPKPASEPAAVAEALTTEPAAGPIVPACVLDPNYSVQDRQGETVAQRLADLEVCKHEVLARLQEVEQRAAELKPVIDDLTARSKAAAERADGAQKKMLALDQQGIDATDPESLKRFTTEYKAASEEYRKATLEASLLTSGAAEQPALAEREKEVLTEPVIAVDASIRKDERGLTALQADLQMTQSLIDTQKALLAQVDQQIARLNSLQDELKQRLAAEQQRRSDCAKQALGAAKAAVAAALEADKLEDAALTMATGAGKAAAGRAQRAAESYISAAQAAASEHPDAQNPRLSLITKQRYLVGHAKALQGDIDYLSALILAQRVRGLQKYAGLIADLHKMGIDPKEFLPEGTTPAEGQDWMVKPEAAQSVAESFRGDAVKAAEAAIESYNTADNDLAKLWVLHTNIGAVHYLLGNLSSGADAQKHLVEARREYDLATRDRRDRPEARAYQGIIESLSAAVAAKPAK